MEEQSPKNEKYVRFGLSILAGIFTAGVGWGVQVASVNSRFDNHERRIGDIEKLDPANMKFQIQQNVGDIASVRSEERTTQASVNEINKGIGKIEQKIDDLKDSIGRK